MRLSGGDPLRWRREFAGHVAESVEELPQDYLAHWFTGLEALRVIEWKQQMAPMTNDPVKVLQECEQMGRDRGLTAALDPPMQAYMLAYRQRKRRLGAQDDRQIPLKGHKPITFREARVNELRHQIIACLRRVRGEDADAR